MLDPSFNCYLHLYPTANFYKTGPMLNIERYSWPKDKELKKELKKVLV